MPIAVTISEAYIHSLGLWLSLGRPAEWSPVKVKSRSPIKWPNQLCNLAHCGAEGIASTSHNVVRPVNGAHNGILNLFKISQINAMLCPHSTHGWLMWASPTQPNCIIFKLEDVYFCSCIFFCVVDFSTAICAAPIEQNEWNNLNSNVLSSLEVGRSRMCVCVLAPNRNNCDCAFEQCSSWACSS